MTKPKKPKKAKALVASSLCIVDDEGNPKIGMYALGKSGYAGISFYKGKGKERYQALQIYITDHQGQATVEFSHGPSKVGLSLGASENGAGMSIFDAEGKHLKAFGSCYDNPELSGDGKKKSKPHAKKSAAKKKA